MRSQQGFTMIEMLIVTTIIATVAALAVPGIMNAQKGANEKSAAASLKAISNAQIDFHSHDRDNNQIRDFWVGDIRGLYAMDPTSDGKILGLIEEVVARADAAPDTSDYSGADGWAISVDSFPKSGYLFNSMAQYQLIDGSLLNFDDQGNGRNNARFGAAAFPQDYTITGAVVLVISHGQTIYKKEGTSLGMVSGVTGAAGMPAFPFPAEPMENGWGPLD